MRGRQILYLRSGCDSNPFMDVLLRRTSTAPAVHRPGHERRFLVGVGCPQRGHYRREPGLLHDALHPVLGHLFGAAHPPKIGVCSFSRCEVAGSRRDEGAVRVVTNPSRTGVPDCGQDPSSVGCRDVNHKCMQLRHGSHRAACSPRIIRNRGRTVAYPANTNDHGYVPRLGQSQCCEPRGLEGRGGPGSSTVCHEVGALGASISALKPALNGLWLSIGRCGNLQVL